ncbi:hypothetical protein [Lyngbya sp. CCAP 1446/10]
MRYARLRSAPLRFARLRFAYLRNCPTVWRKPKSPTQQL